MNASRHHVNTNAPTSREVLFADAVASGGWLPT